MFWWSSNLGAQNVCNLQKVLEQKRLNCTVPVSVDSAPHAKRACLWQSFKSTHFCCQTKTDYFEHLCEKDETRLLQEFEIVCI